MRRALALALVAAAIASAAVAAPVPQTVSFSARLVDEKSGHLLEGAHHVDFELFDAADGGASVWKEARDVAVEDGLLFVALGEIQPFAATVFTGRRLYLQVTLDDVVMEPRVSIESVPYAIRASGADNADTVGGIPAGDLQRRVTGMCDPGSFVTAINPDGTVTCSADAAGNGDITAVTAGTGLEGGGPLGDVTLSLLKSCAASQVLKWDGAGWGCADDVDTNAGGDVTAVIVTATGGLEGGGASGDVGLSLLTSCAAGQLLKWDGAAWSCANDIDTDTDTNAGGDITAVTAGGGSGLEGGGATGDIGLSLLTTCAPGQMLKWSGAAWGCADDIDTDTDTNAGGDITAVTAGSGLEGGGATGDVGLSLLTTCALGQMLKWNGTAWGCADDIDTDTDTNAGGDITAVTTGGGSGLIGGAAAGDAALSLLTTCAPGQLLKWNGTAWGCANDIDTDTDTNSGGDITAVTTSGGSGLIGGTVAGDAALSLLTSCAPGQLLKWNGTGWACANDTDTDTDTNSGGDITDVIAGPGLGGGGTAGAVTVNVTAGTGITVGAGGVALDVAFTDPRYVNTSGDTMTGALDMNNQRLLNRACRTGYIRVGPGLCIENPDQNGFTFSGCANRCRGQGTHMCSSGEMRAVLGSGVALGSSVLLDWLDDQESDDNALYVNQINAENPDGGRATSTSSYCRCCADVE
ncbi:MAG TPA: hypothetical protein VNO30_05925 [Kofleriaceae bacterium]|nr:hypothetical protein [Kofleriaceae bacterium]